MSTFIETKVKYNKLDDKGNSKKYSDTYLIDASTFTEAEEKTVKECTPYLDDFTVSAVKKSNISEIFKGPGERFYKVKCIFSIINEGTGQEKKTSVYMLVQAKDFDDAIYRFNENMRGTIVDYEISGVNETNITEVFI